MPSLNNEQVHAIHMYIETAMYAVTNNPVFIAPAWEVTDKILQNCTHIMWPDNYFLSLIALIVNCFKFWYNTRKSCKH